MPAVFLIIVIPLAFILGYFFSFYSSLNLPNSTNVQKEKEQIFSEKIPGSRFHSPDATWWGYNMSKIVRFKDIVFSYYIDNDDDSNKTVSRFIVMKKYKDGAWEEGVVFSTSRPGNLLIDSKGILHAFVFEPFDVKTNDSWGRIIHYYFPDAPKGDIKNYKQEIVVDNDGRSETANIRFGAAIGKDDTMAISFGLTKFNPEYQKQSEHIYFKKPNEEKWNHVFIENLPHDYFYPFTLVSKDGFHLLPVQDDYNGLGNSSILYPNIYQKIMYLKYQNGNWQNELVADLSNHKMAKVRPRLLEQEDLFEDNKGNIHIIYKEFLDPNNDYAATVHWHLTGKLGNFKAETIRLEKPGVNWVRLVEIDNNLYYLITTFGELFISPADNIQLTKIDIPEDAKSFYPYVAASKSGTKESEYIDVLLLGADQKLFAEGKSTNYYLRIPKSYIKF